MDRSSENNKFEEDGSTDVLLQIERLNLLRKGIPTAVVGNIALAIILVYIQLPVFSLNVLFVWLVAMMVVLAWRIFIFCQSNLLSIKSNLNKELILFRMSTVATGLIWACVPTFLFPENNIAVQAVLSFVLAGICAAAASSLSMDRISALGFILPPLLSLAVAFLMEGGKESITMALMTIFFSGFVVLSCVRSERQFCENIRLRNTAILREKALFSSEARLRSLFDLSPFGIVLNDFASGDIIEVNDRLVALSGYTKEEFINLDHSAMTPEDYKSREDEQRCLLIASGRYGPYEKELIRKDGSRYPVIVNGVMTTDHSGRKLIWSIVEDISERKRIDKMKNEFISTVSHELRTPLTAISGALGLLSNLNDSLPAPMQNMLRIAGVNSQRLSQLINDLLDIEKITSEKMAFNIQRQAVLPLVEQAIETTAPYAMEYGVQLLLSNESIAAEAFIDPLRLQQVLANLLSNAIKFSPKGAAVTVVVLRGKGDSVRITVSDLGPGVPELFRHRIFQKFSQADSSDTRAKGGTGLGLAITKELVEKMRGTVGFDSIEGQGSSFWVELPLAAP